MQWPEFYHGIKNSLYDQWGIRKIAFLRILGGGKSQSLVYVIDILSKVHNGHAILKYSTKCQWSVTEQVEAKRFKKVCTGEYARIHFPPLLATFENEVYSVALIGIAGGELNLLSSLYECPEKQKNEVISTLSVDILERWNSHYNAKFLFSPAFILREWLGYRIIPAEGGRIHEYIEKELKFNYKSTLVIIDGHSYPNPGAYIEDGSLWCNNEVTGIRGILHGDLHGGNILVKKDNSGILYYLIDFALSEEEAFLFYDHAYLELSLLISERGHVDLEKWLTLLKALVTSYPLDVDLDKSCADDLGIVHNIRNIRRGISSWAATNTSIVIHRENVAKQAMLARIAAGLNFVNKDIESTLRKFAYLYAAVNLKKYLEYSEFSY